MTDVKIKSPERNQLWSVFDRRAKRSRCKWKNPYVTLNFPKTRSMYSLMFHVPKEVITFALFPEILISHTNEE